MVLKSTSKIKAYLKLSIKQLPSALYDIPGKSSCYLYFHNWRIVALNVFSVLFIFVSFIKDIFIWKHNSRHSKISNQYIIRPNIELERKKWWSLKYVNWKSTNALKLLSACPSILLLGITIHIVTISSYRDPHKMKNWFRSWIIEPKMDCGHHLGIYISYRYAKFFFLWFGFFTIRVQE